MSRVHLRILCSVCPRCRRLEHNLRQVLDELSLDAEVERITDIHRFPEFGFARIPALFVNGRLVSHGRAPSVKELRKILQQASGGDF